MDDQPDPRYAEAAHSVDLASITSYLPNIEFLRRLRDNDPELTKLVICEHVGGTVEYQPDSDEDMGWLGHFIGENTHLRELALCYPFPDWPNDSLHTFFRGVSRNRSLRKLFLGGINVSTGNMAQIMRPFLENNTNLHRVEIEQCAFGGDEILSKMVRSCKSVRKLHLRGSLANDEEPPTKIIKACGTLAQLVDLSLDEMNIGAAESISLGSLPIFCSLEKLSLSGNWLGEDPDDIQALTNALKGGWARRLRRALKVPKGVAPKGGCKLRTLDLSHNNDISRHGREGLRSLAEMLEDPATNLEELNLLFSGVDDEGATILSRALANNSKLRRLILVADELFYDAVDQVGDWFNKDHRISAHGWQAFANVLCNTSSMEATFGSNHSLVSFSRTNNLRFDDDGSGSVRRRPRQSNVSCGRDILLSVKSSLEMNRGEHVSTAKSKTIERHLRTDEGMTCFADMERAVWPHFIAWVPSDEPSLLYRFVRSVLSQHASDPAKATAKEPRADRKGRAWWRRSRN